MTEILVIEDDDVMRLVVTRTLERYGYVVTAVRSGDEALQALEESPDRFDLVVLDLMLGPVSGWDVLEEMNRAGLRDHAKVVVLSALQSEDDFLKGWQLGVDDYVTKPFDPDRFVLAVQEVLLSPKEELRRKRLEELQKAELLHLVDSAFGEEA